MKRFPALLTLVLLTISLVAPNFVLAQRPGTLDGRPAGRRPRPSSDPRLIAIQRDFDEALKLVQEQYVDGKKLNYNDAFKSSIIGMLRSLDPHSNYYDREEFEELKTDQRSEYFGIGASIQNYIYKDQADTYITATFDASPAGKAGLRYGDRIVEVDGVPMTGKTSLEVRDKIRGPRGSTVKLTLERAADKRIEKVEIVRDAVPQPSIPDAYMLRPGVGYIDMTRGFNYTTTDELVDAIDRLETKGMKSLVLDLRNNPGGFLDQAIHVAEVFLPTGQLILTQKGRNGFRDNTFESKNSSPNTTPLVILINENTASASEIVAGAMQDHDRALIVGQTSFGKGLVQSIIPLDYGAGLTLTSAKYFTPSGRLIQRDYSNGGFYDYYTHGAGIARDPKQEPAKPSGPERKTDTGRAVYGGGGITPDENVNPRTVNLTQRRMLSPIFSFVRELVNGRVRGLESSKISRGIVFDHDLTNDEYRITDSTFRAFRDFVANDPAYNVTPAMIDRYRSFVELELRFNVVTAAHGRVVGDRVFITTDDPQVSKAVDVLPKARNLARGTTDASIRQ
ncbi:MAG TPA: S41 family peptidase [Pyrinomonadaceae bacterium]|jgi:carboxyl-terminal processing protease|nr:S41 family peptidase [Pyrinomonadaceae bacterium]